MLGFLFKNFKMKNLKLKFYFKKKQQNNFILNYFKSIVMAIFIILGVFDSN